MINLRKILRKCIKNKRSRNKSDTNPHTRKKIGNVGLQFSGREGNTKTSRCNHSVFFLGREGEHHRRTEVAIANLSNEEAGIRDKKMRSITHINQIRHQTPRNQEVQINLDKKKPKPKTEKFLAFLKIREQTLETQMPTKEIPVIPTTISRPSVISEQPTHMHIVTLRKSPKVRTQRVPKIPTEQLVTLKGSKGEHPTTRVLIHPKDNTKEEFNNTVNKCTGRIESARAKIKEEAEVTCQRL